MAGFKYHVFLSYSSSDRLAVEELALRLQREGIEPWLDKWNLIPGDAWQPAIEAALADCATCAVFISPGGFGAWQHEEMRGAIDRRVVESRTAAADGQKPFRVIPVLLPAAERPEPSRLPTFLTATTWVEFRRSLDDEEAFRRLVCGIRGIEPGAGLSGAAFEGACPYRGLEVFDVEHAPFFFGREALTEWLIVKLRASPSGQENRFLAILGASGSGKSSLARAGLIPAIKRGELVGSAEWPVVIFKPGRDPIESLAVALTGLDGARPSPVAVQGLMTGLQDTENTLHLTTRLALRDAPSARRLVLLVDQFEEVFTLCEDEKTRQALFTNLLYAATIAGGQTIVLLTMRADFYSKCGPYPALAAAMSDHQLLVGPMTEDELRRAIERPAQLAGGEFEPGLVEILLQDVARQPGALPMLQFALMELWQRREGRRLTVADYRAIGGLQGALEGRANEVLSTFNDTERETCRRIFLRLTQPGEGTEDTKRRASFGELVPAGSDAKSLESVISRLADARYRLITIVGDPKDPGKISVEVAHEALIRGWDRLREWIDADRVGLRNHRRLTEAAREWDEKGRPHDDYLETGTRLALAREWAHSHHGDLSVLERAFLAASVKAERRSKSDRLAAALRLAEEAEKRAEAEKKQREEAQRLQLGAVAGLLASQAVPLALGRRAQSDVPALLAIQAHRFNEESQGREHDLVDRALRSVLDLPHFTEVLPNAEDVTSLALSPDARWLACGCKNGTLQVWDLRRTGPLWSTLRSKPPAPRWSRPVHDAPLAWLVAHPTLPVVACVALDGAVFLIHLECVDVPPLRLEGTASINRSYSIFQPDRYWIEYPPAHLAFRHDGTFLLVAPGLGFDVSELENRFEKGQPPPRRDLPDPPGAYFGFSTDGKVLASYTPYRGGHHDWGDHVQKVSRADLDAPRAVGGDTVNLLDWYGGQIRSGAVSFCPCTISPDGRWVVQFAGGWTVSSEMKLWDVSGPEGERHPINLRPELGFVGSRFMVFDRDSVVFAAGSSHFGVLDLRRPTVPPLLLGGWGEVATAALSPGGRVMATVVVQGTPEPSAVWPILVWPLAPTDPACAVLEGHRGAVRGLAFSPDGSDLVSCGIDGTVRVWDLKGESPDPLTIDLARYGARHVPVFEEFVSYDRSRPGQPVRRCAAPIAVDPCGGRIALAVVGRDGDADRERVLVFRRAPGEQPPLVLQPPLKDRGDSGVCSPIILALRFAAGGETLYICDQLPLPDSGASICSGFGAVRAWNLSGRPERQLTRLETWGVQPQVALDEAGTLFSACSMTEQERYNPSRRPTGVKVWDPADPRKPPRVLACVGDDFTAVAVSPGPRFCAAAESSGVVWVWDLSQPDAEPVARQVHYGPVLAVAFGPGDGLLAAGGDDGTVAVWALDQPEAKPIVLSGHQAAANCLAFSPDGRLLASGSDDGTVRLWIIDLALLAGLVEERVQRNLTPTEWRRYVGPGIDYRLTCPDLPPGEEPPSWAGPFTEPLKGSKSPRLSRHEAEA